MLGRFARLSMKASYAGLFFLDDLISGDERYAGHGISLGYLPASAAAWRIVFR